MKIEPVAALRGAIAVPGVKGISNLIAVRPKVQPQDLKRKIDESFRRDAALDAERITVEVSGGEVTLRQPGLPAPQV